MRTYDNGRVLETTFVDGVRSEAMMTDGGDAYAWTSYTDTFDFQGARASRSMTYDDGREAATTYISGVRSEAIMTDGGDAYTWTSYTDTFDAVGDRIERSFIYDDGSTDTFIF